VKLSFGAQIVFKKENENSAAKCSRKWSAHVWRMNGKLLRIRRESYAHTRRPIDFQQQEKQQQQQGNCVGSSQSVQPTSHPVSQPVGQSVRLKQLPQLNYENVYKTGPFSPQQQSIRRLKAKEKLCVLWCRRVAAKR